MALINCGECGKSVSDKAAACPHCGAPVKPAPGASPGVAPASAGAEKAGGWVPLWILVPLGLVVAFLIFGVVSHDPQRSSDRAAYELCKADMEKAERRGQGGRADFVEGACQLMRQRFIEKHGAAP